MKIPCSVVCACLVYYTCTCTREAASCTKVLYKCRYILLSAACADATVTAARWDNDTAAAVAVRHFEFSAGRFWLLTWQSIAYLFFLLSVLGCWHCVLSICRRVVFHVLFSPRLMASQKILLVLDGRRSFYILHELDATASCPLVFSARNKKGRGLFCCCLLLKPCHHDMHAKECAT